MERHNDKTLCGTLLLCIVNLRLKKTFMLIQKDAPKLVSRGPVFRCLLHILIQAVFMQQLFTQEPAKSLGP